MSEAAATAEPDGATGTRRGRAAAAGEPAGDGRKSSTRSKASSSKRPTPYNEALPFIEFVDQYPVGSEVEAVVERFSSHGAYVMTGDPRAYVPLRNLAAPPPRSAKEVLSPGESRRFVVVRISPRDDWSANSCRARDTE